MTKTRFTVLAAALFGLCAGPTLAAAPTAATAAAGPVTGQKLDNGLGELPHYRLWADPSGRAPLSAKVAGESLDDGVGALPHYSLWLDPTGRDPMGRESQHVASARR